MRLPSKKDRKDADQLHKRICDLAGELYEITDLVPDADVPEAVEHAFKRFRGEPAKDAADFIPPGDPGDCSLDDTWDPDEDSF